MAESLYTTAVINGEEYQFKKFTAITGLQIARLVLSKFAPIIPLIGNKEAVEIGKEKGVVDKEAAGADKKTVVLDEFASIIGAAIETVTDDDLEQLTKKCLRVCSKKLKTGWVDCLDKNGNYAIEGLEYDLVTTILLIVEAIKWGAGDFFGEKASGLLQQFKPDSKPSGA